MKCTQRVIVPVVMLWASMVCTVKTSLERCVCSKVIELTKSLCWQRVYWTDSGLCLEVGAGFQILECICKSKFGPLLPNVLLFLYVSEPGIFVPLNPEGLCFTCPVLWFCTVVMHNCALLPWLQICMHNPNKMCFVIWTVSCLRVMLVFMHSRPQFGHTQDFIPRIRLRLPTRLT